MARRHPRAIASTLVLLLALGAGACRSTPRPPSAQGQRDAAARAKGPEPIRLTLAATNDLHGWVQPHVLSLPGGQSIAQGGVSILAGYLAILRAENPGGVLAVDGGDLFQGTLASNLTEGEVVIESYNRLGYAAAALGNHEFDYGPEGPVSVATRPEMDPFGALKKRFAQARFPLLSVNLYDAKTGDRPAWLPNDGTAIVEAKGVKVGFLGLVTPATPQLTNPVNVSTLRFGSLVPEAQAAARRLRERGAELVIALVHAAGECRQAKDPHDLSRCDTQTGELFELLQGLPPGTLDFVVAGHSHSTISHVVNGTPMVESPGMGQYLTRVELFVDPRTRKLLPERTVMDLPVPLCAEWDRELGTCELYQLKKREKIVKVPATYRGQPVVPDRELERLVAPALAKVEQMQRRPLGLHVPKSLGRDYENESALGNFLADTTRAMAAGDFALLNSGGLRADLPAGQLTYGHVYEVIPFDNTVATVTLTGEELKRLLYAGYGARKGVFQVSGLDVTLSRCPGPSRLRAVKLPGGKLLVPDRMYRLIVPDFLARGGDGLGAVLASLPPERIDMGLTREHGFRDALIAYWQTHKTPLVAPRGAPRIHFVDSAESCPSLNEGPQR